MFNDEALETFIQIDVQSLRDVFVLYSYKLLTNASQSIVHLLLVGQAREPHVSEMLSKIRYAVNFLQGYGQFPTDYEA